MTRWLQELVKHLNDESALTESRIATDDFADVYQMMCEHQARIIRAPTRIEKVRHVSRLPVCRRLCGLPPLWR